MCSLACSPATNVSRPETRSSENSEVETAILKCGSVTFAKPNFPVSVASNTCPSICKSSPACLGSKENIASPGLNSSLSNCAVMVKEPGSCKVNCQSCQ